MPTLTLLAEIGILNERITALTQELSACRTSWALVTAERDELRKQVDDLKKKVTVRDKVIWNMCEDSCNCGYDYDNNTIKRMIKSEFAKAEADNV
jgi:uncharacterized coiled-coil DUF342 family protein